MSIKKDLVNIPNLLTLFRIFLIPVVCYLLTLADPLACVGAAVAFGIASLTDLFDGAIARAKGLVTLTGKLLDPLADKLIVMAMLVVLVDLSWFPAWLVIVVLAREFTITGLRAIASSEGIVIEAGRGGKYKTAFQLTGLTFLVIHYDYVLNFWFFESPVNFHRAGLVLFGLSVFFSIWSGVGYIVSFYKALGVKAATEAAAVRAPPASGSGHLQ